MKPVEIKGIIPPILTPMNDDESINVAELRNQVDRMIEGGVHALFPFGTNGEGYILNAKEKQLVLETVIEQCNGRVPVYAGTGCISTKETIEQSKMAQAAGADFVGAEELIPKIQNEGWLDFDVVVATPDMMGVVGRLGRVLGPKGLMPNPKAGTVTMDVTKAVNDIKAGKIEYRLDKANIIHVPIGKASFSEEQLADNFQTLIDAVNKAKPATLKGQYMKSVSVAPTMGPGVKINPLKLV